MPSSKAKPFSLGPWDVQPALNTLSLDGTEHHVEPKVMQVLLTLVAQAGQVVAKEDLIAAVWPDTFVGDDVLTRCISILRRVTEDDAHAPRFIQTVPKVGYRLVAPVVGIPVLSSTGTLTADVSDVASPPVSDVMPSLAANAGQSPRRLRLLGVGIGLLTLLCVALAATLWRQNGHATTPAGYGAFRTIEFTSEAGEQTEPAISPDGQTIAFVLVPGDQSSRRIFLKRIGSESIEPLTKASEGEEFSPAWSPDGKRVAFLARSPRGLGIYLALVGSTEPPRKVFIPQQPSHWEQGALSWSPDGTYLVFPDHTGSQPDSSIFQLNLPTGEVRSLTTPPPGFEGDLNPAYSPDGTKIAFTRASETAVRDIYWMTRADGLVHQLTHDRMDINSLAWSHDSRSLIFSSNRAGKEALWRMVLTAIAPERLPYGTEDAAQPAIGPLANQLAYVQGSTVWTILRLDVGHGHDDQAQPTVILSSTQQDSAPTLSPDARYFAIQSVRSGTQEIWIASVAGAPLRQLTFMGGPLTGSPAWSHTGDRILFDSRPDGHSHIFSVSADGGKTQQLTFGSDNDIVPRWSYDDRVVYFRSNRGGRWQLWKVSSTGGSPQPVTTQDGIVPQESPDGRYLYFARGDEDGLWRVPVGGGREEHVLDQPAARYWGYWATTTRGIIYLDLKGAQPRIRLLNAETNQSMTLMTLQHTPPPFNGIAASADAQTLLMTDEQTGGGRHITLIEGAKPGGR